MKEYMLSAEQILHQTQSAQNGLTTAEATERLKANGKNMLAEGKKTSVIVKFKTADRPDDTDITNCRYR